MTTTDQSREFLNEINAALMTTFGIKHRVTTACHPLLITVSFYSQASNNGPSEKWTTALQWTSSVLGIEISIIVILKQPPRSRPSRFRTADKTQTSQRDFQIQNCIQIADMQETRPIQCLDHAHKTAWTTPMHCTLA